MTKPRESLHPLLKEMSQIQRMERGKLCRMRGRPYFNHQTWQDGRNVVRYVPAERLESLQQAIEGYQLYMELARQYAEEIVERTRQALQQEA